MVEVVMGRFGVVVASVVGVVLVVAGMMFGEDESVVLPAGFQVPAVLSDPVPLVVAATTPTVSPAPVDGAGVVSGLTVPGLGIDLGLVPGGVSGNRFRLPADVNKAMFVVNGRLGETGSVVVSGHVRSGGVWGPLRALSAAKPNMTAEMTMGGERSVWRLVGLKATLKADLPSELFTSVGSPRLFLVTCGGRVVNGHYDHNIIAEFVPV